MTTLKNIAGELRAELTDNILPFWADSMVDRARGGFIGRISGAGEIDCTAQKGAIMHARILWTFSAAYRVLRNPSYLETAARAKNYLIEQFYDTRYGGIYWSLNPDGTPRDTKKQFYALAFAIYGFSEYVRATGDAEALRYASLLFHDIETHSFDSRIGGYIEASACTWEQIEDQRLSEKEANVPMTMNTHLHILEAYTNLYRISATSDVASALRRLINIFVEKIERPDHHLGLFFNDRWESIGSIVSYGHDIEASWLLQEAAEVLADDRLTHIVSKHATSIFQAATEGYQSDGSLVYEQHPDGTLDAERHWWVQAETIVGLFYRYRRQNDVTSLGMLFRTWAYIQNHLVDRESGEWFWSAYADGTPNHKDDKAGFWKCPYHNGRMCLQLLEQLGTARNSDEINITRQ